MFTGKGRERLVEELPRIYIKTIERLGKVCRFHLELFFGRLFELISCLLKAVQEKQALVARGEEHKKSIERQISTQTKVQIVCAYIFLCGMYAAPSFTLQFLESHKATETVFSIWFEHKSDFSSIKERKVRCYMMIRLCFPDLRR